MSCNLCSSIPSKEDVKATPWYDRYGSCIVYNQKENQYEFWVEVDDCYYSHSYLTLNYCPHCGRKLDTFN